MITLLLLGFAILIVALFMLYRLFKRNKAVLNIAVPHKILRNGTIEVELEDLSTLWLDQPIQSVQMKVVAPLTEPDLEPEPMAKPLSATQEPLIELAATTVINWYESGDFIKFLTGCINEHINHCSDNNFTAFSFNGIVYLTPFGLWSYIMLYTKAKGLEQKDKRSTMLSVVKSLIKHDLIKAGDIQEGNYTATYLITASKKDTKLKPKGVYIPLIAEHFNTDNKKEGVLTFISNIELYKEVANAE